MIEDGIEKEIEMNVIRGTGVPIPCPLGYYRDTPMASDGIGGANSCIKCAEGFTCD